MSGRHALHHGVTIDKAVFQRYPDVARDQECNDNGSAVMNDVRQKSQRFVFADQYGQIKEPKKTHPMSARHSMHVARDRLQENQQVQDPMQAVGGSLLRFRNTLWQRRGFVGEPPAESKHRQRENQNSYRSVRDARSPRVRSAVSVIVSIGMPRAVR
jgi:hypothetical protein